MLRIDGSQYSGSGTIIRQAVAFSALTKQPIHVVNARARRAQPGLRRQHMRVVEAICELVNGTAEGVYVGSKEIRFRPGTSRGKQKYVWDIGSAGATTMLALGVLPVLAFRATTTMVEIRGGLFQDFAPSVFHLQHVMIPLLRQMGLKAQVEMRRPGYVPLGEGRLYLKVKPTHMTLNPFRMIDRGSVKRIWGIALASHLMERRVSHRMAEAARAVFAEAGHQVQIETREDLTAEQPGAAFAAFADCEGGVRLGADRAGAPRRTSESIGKYVARQLLVELETKATVDRFAADQVIPFAALAKGESRLIIPRVTDHIQTSAWLAKLILGAEVRIENSRLVINGIGFSP